MLNYNNDFLLIIFVVEALILVKNPNNNKCFYECC